jgi:hypothetical protein
MPRQAYNRSVFINCPFDDAYREQFRAMVFTLLRCGFHARSSLEIDDGSVVRIQKIFDIVEQCRYGIHDLSRVELHGGFPRFNMPLELGIFLAAKRYGTGQQDKKSALIFEHRKFTYNKFISDINGQDIRAHGGRAKKMVAAIRDWLQSYTKSSLPGGSALWNDYKQFKSWLSPKCRAARLDRDALTWDDLYNLVEEWIETSSS